MASKEFCHLRSEIALVQNRFADKSIAGIYYRRESAFARQSVG
jgi:hypothetical protein